MNCDPSSLANAATCFDNCIPPGMQRAVQTYLLAQISNALSGTSTDPKTLVQLATTYPNSFQTIIGSEQEVIAYLLCQIANASGA